MYLVLNIDQRHHLYMNQKSQTFLINRTGGSICKVPRSFLDFFYIVIKCGGKAAGREPLFCGL